MPRASSSHQYSYRCPTKPVEEQGRRHVRGRESRTGLAQVVHVPVIEGDCHGVTGQRAALQAAHELRHRQRVAGAAEDFEVLFEPVRMHGEPPRIHSRAGDPVIHENRRRRSRPNDPAPQLLEERAHLTAIFVRAGTR